MEIIESFLKKYSILFQILLFLVAAVILSIDIGRPLVDYDEATYAHVIHDTLESGDFSTFQLNGNNWFEKPPLHLWATMLSVKVFGENEYALRIPSILAALICCWLVYLIVRYQTKSEIAAGVGFLVLLFSNSFFVFARELRLDSSVTAAILAALYFWMKGLQKEKYLFWILPMIAVGILCKSVIGLLAVPIIFIYCIYYKKWSWLKSKYLWLGFLASLIIVAPWHIAETIRFGGLFWDDYFGEQIVHRATSTMTGTDDYYDYLAVLWSDVPWIWLLFAQLILVVSLNLSKKFKKIPLKETLALLTSTAFIVFIFTLQKSHLGTYIIPVFPLLAICIGVLFHHISSLSLIYRRVAISVFSAALVFSIFICLSYNLYAKVPTFTYEERAAGIAYRNNPPAKLYSLDWNVHETVNYYAHTQLTAIDPHTASGSNLQAPFYIFVTIPAETYFFYSFDKPSFEGLRILYQGKQFALIYGDKDITLPNFICCSH